MDQISNLKTIMAFMRMSFTRKKVQGHSVAQADFQAKVAESPEEDFQARVEVYQVVVSQEEDQAGSLEGASRQEGRHHRPRQHTCRKNRQRHLQ